MGRVSIRSMPDDIITTLDSIAEQHHRSREGEIKAAIEAWIDQHTKIDPASTAIEKQRSSVAERFAIVLTQLHQVTPYDRWTESVIAEASGELNSASIVAGVHGESDLSFEQMERISQVLGINPDWLKHGRGSIYLTEMKRLQGDLNAIVNELTAPDNDKLPALHLIREQSETGRLILVQEFVDSPAARLYTTPHHISHEIGAGGEGDLVEVFDLMRRLYNRKTNALVLGYLTPESEIQRFFQGELHPLKLVERSRRSIWWEDVWDQTSLERGGECWPGQHSLTTRILEVERSRAVSRPFVWPGEVSEEDGRIWWDALSRQERRDWLDHAGQWSRPIDAWNSYQRSQVTR